MAQIHGVAGGHFSAGGGDCEAENAFAASVDAVAASPVMGRALDLLSCAAR